MTIDEIVEFDDLNKEDEKKTQDPEEAAKIIERYEDIIKTKNKGIINVAYHQGQVLKYLKKRKSLLSSSVLGSHKTTIIFKINVFKLCKKYPKLLKSSIDLEFFKSYHKDINAICEEYENDFQC